MLYLPQDMQRTGKWTPQFHSKPLKNTSLCWKVDRIVPFYPHYYLSAILSFLLNVALYNSYIVSEDKMTCLSPDLAILFKITHNYVTVSLVFLGKIHFVSLVTTMRIYFARKLSFRLFYSSHVSL